MTETETPYFCNRAERIAFLVEAPGKRARLAELASKAWPETTIEVFATKGHVASFPEDFRQDDVCPESGTMPRRNLERSALVLFERVIAFAPSIIVLAMDDDEEGHLIAKDCAEWFAEAAPDVSLCRLRLRSLDTAGFARACREMVAYGPECYSEAASAYARTGLDRWLAVRHSPTKGTGVGRIVSPLLRILAERPRDTLWRVVRPIGHGMSASTTLRSRRVLPHAEIPPPPPMPAEVLSQATSPTSHSLALGPLMHRLTVERIGGCETLEETAESLQHLYESGQLSYCRPSGTWLPNDAVRDLAIAAGLRRCPDRPAWLAADGEGHPALAPVSPPFGLALAATTGLDRNTAVLTQVARWQAEAVWSVLGTVRKTDDPAWRAWCLEAGFGEEAAEPTWIIRQATLPWQERRTRPMARVVPETVPIYVFRRLLENRLGRPSTWLEHVRKVCGHGLVDDAGKPTLRGWRWLRAAPPWLTKPETSQRLEEACRRAVPQDGEGELQCRARLRRVLRMVQGDASLRQERTEEPSAPDHAPMPGSFRV